MKVVVDQRGGISGMERRIEIDGHTLTVSGDHVGNKNLSAQEQKFLSKLLPQLLDDEVSISKYSGFPPSDSLYQMIVLEIDGKPPKTLQISSGDKAPRVLWEFLAFVNKLSSPILNGKEE